MMPRTTRDFEYIDRDDLHRILRESDAVVLTLALTRSTENIFGKAEPEAMKPIAFLINGGRGGLIDEGALIDAMNTKIIGGAGLDTVNTEPLPQDSPLWDLPNTIIAPHSGALTDNIGGEIGKS